MYLFLNLKHQEISDQIDPNVIFLKSEEFSDSSNIISFTDPLLCFNTKLNDNINYYVIHDAVAVKGKSKKLKGKIVLTTKKDLIDYIKTKDIRPIRIMSEQNQDFLIKITDEESALFFSR